MAELKVGDPVWHIPHAAHWNDSDHLGEPVFHFLHHDDGPPVPRGQKGVQAHAGDTVPHGKRQWGTGKDHDQLPLGKVERIEPHPDGPPILFLSKGHTIRATRPLRAWQARVIRVYADGTAGLCVKHPNGEVHLKPDHEAQWAHEAHRLERVALAVASFLEQPVSETDFYSLPLFPAEQDRARALRAAVLQAQGVEVEKRFDALHSALASARLLDGITQIDADVGQAAEQSLAGLLAKHPLVLRGSVHDPSGQLLHSFHLPGEAGSLTAKGA